MQRIDDGPLTAGVTRYLAGVEFPGLKQDLILAFRRNDAPDEVVARLHTLAGALQGIR